MKISVKFLSYILVFTIFIFYFQANTMEETEQLKTNYLPIKGGKYSNPLVKNVEEIFKKISSNPVTSEALNNKIIPYPFYLYSSNDNNWGINNHFQGIERLPEYLGLGQYFVVSGSNPKTKTQTDDTPTADLFIIKNELIIKHVVIDDKGSWHPGGMQTCGKYLAIPLEGQNPRVVFYDMSNPEKPKKLNTLINRKGKTKSGSVAITRLENGLYFITVWSDTEGFDFYLSTEKTLENSIFDFLWNIPTTKNYRENQQYNAIHFVQDTQKNLYLIGTDNPSKAAPILNLPNIADLFLVHIDYKSKTDAISLEHKKTKKFPAVCTSNFDAGCGIYIPDSNHIYFYACNTFLSTFKSNCCQYCCCLTSQKTETFITFDQYETE